MGVVDDFDLHPGGVELDHRSPSPSRRVPVHSRTRAFMTLSRRPTYARIRVMMHRTNRLGAWNRRGTSDGRPRRARCPYADGQSMMDVMESTRLDRWLWAV